jgi:tRNA-modifying protein YgfZ
MDSFAALNGIARLGYFACIRVTGPDAGAFLQSQLTSDFASLAADRARLAGFCSAKGRLQASFIGWKASQGDIVLMCAADLLVATLKRLSMFVLRMKCTLIDATTALPVHGLAGSSVNQVLPGASPWELRDSDAGTAIRLPDAGGHALALWLPRSGESAALPSSPEAPELSQEQWRWLSLATGIPVIETKTVDLFVPQMVNFELLGGVDFQKGCYPGQEVVARSQYRGTLKRRMFLFDCDAHASAGEEVFGTDDPGQPAGIVVNAAARPEGAGSSLLVEVKLSEVQRGSLSLGRPQGPALLQRALPYSIPLPANQTA